MVVKSMASEIRGSIFEIHFSTWELCNLCQVLNRLLASQGGWGDEIINICKNTSDKCLAFSKPWIDVSRYPHHLPPLLPM